MENGSRAGKETGRAGLGFPKSKLHRNIALGSNFFSSFKAKLFFSVESFD